MADENFVLVDDFETQQKKLKEIVNLPEDEFLELISRKAFNYFWNEASHVSGLVKDRNTTDSPSSISATGFGLSAICIADSRGWISHTEAYDRIKNILHTLKFKIAKENGFFYHFVDMHKATRVWDSEVSSVDTALLLGGVIVVHEYFQDEYIRELCDEIYCEVQWTWMLEPNTKTLYMGWKPETGFRNFILWDMFAEQMIMYILGLGSHTYPLPKKSWHAFRRPLKTYDGRSYIYCESESLFTYQYSHAFVDFRNIYDRYTNYWQNSINAIMSNRQFCIDNSKKYRTYREGYWGLSASDGPYGYKNYGATIFTHDGTVAPYAICASVPFVPEVAMSTLRELLSEYGDRVWGEYGFVSAFNLNENWFSTEYVGIDLGITLLMIENYRSGFMWKYFMKNEYVRNGLKSAGFKPGTRELNVALLEKLNKQEKIILSGTKRFAAVKTSSLPLIDGILTEWSSTKFAKFELPDDIEFGTIESSADLNAKFSFMWDNNYLYFAVDVLDNKIVAKEEKNKIYRADCVELYLGANPGNFIWGDKNNFQIGFAPHSIEGTPVVWAFFQDIDPSEFIKTYILTHPDGYTIESAIKWQFIGIKPEKNLSVGVSVAVHDVDRPGGPGKKINWSFKNTPSGIKLGEIYLKN